MNLKKIKLNIYSFGYSAGFIGSSIVHDDNSLLVDLQKVKELALANNMGGIEFPFDYFFKDNFKKGVEFLNELHDCNIDFFLDLEKFDTALITELIPVLKSFNMDSIRIKMDHTGPVFYGGNRYCSDHFEESVELFKKKIKSLLPTLKKNRFKLLIENHQDLSSLDLKELCEEFGPECLGVNWDIGNSLSTGETVETFFDNTKNLIGNVHIKDYKIVRTDKGFKLVRCAIGQGSFGIESWLTKLEAMGKTMSIELGAEISRECFIRDDRYFNSYDYSLEKRNEFMSFIEKYSLPSGETVFESNPNNGKLIVDTEMQEIESSISYLEALNAK